MKSIVEQIFDNAKLSPNKVALIEGKKSVTYGELVTNILCTKQTLANLYHLKKDDSIVIAANKQLEFVYTYFACHLLGVVAVPIDYETNSTRFDLIKNKVNPRLIVGFRNIADTFVLSVDYNYIDYNAKGNMGGFPDMKSDADIVFTTGTTGAPKGVVLSHENISAAAKNINTFVGNNKQDVELLALPISHSFGLGRLRCVLSQCGTIILLGSFVNVKRIFRFFDQFEVTGFAMVPASWAFLKKMSGLKLGEFSSQLKYIEIGSAAMPIEDKELLMSLFPHTRICMHYGLTEASRSTFIEFNSESTMLSTIGKPSPNISIKIKDQNGNNLPLEHEGEICVKGDSVLKGYYKESDSSKGSFYGDYFRTGDWGVTNKNGYITLLSRKKELINVGGKKVSPIEIEEVLNKIEWIEDSACIGIEDDNKMLGEVVKAFIVTPSAKIDVEYITKHLSNHLESYKIPTVFEIIHEIPKTSSGKIQRLLLKKK